MKIVVNKPILRIFFNVDIIGSTNYKVNLSYDEIHPWLPLFKEFYQTFPKIFNQIITEKKNNNLYKNIKTKKMNIWKLLGDEIIFYSELIDSKACGLFISALKEAINLYQKKYIPKELGLKACAYIAGFPVNNVHIKVNNTDDFIGPNIDVGFRLRDFATKEKMPISIELAYILTQHNFDFEYFFEGLKILKGVLNNKPYPIFAIDMQNSEELKDLMPNVEANKVLRYCIDFIESNDLIEFPFIENDKRNTLIKKPKNYEKKLEEIKHIYGLYETKKLEKNVNKNIKTLLEILKDIDV